MDIVTGLTAVSQAIQIAKDLRGIDRSIDEATYKLKLSDLTLALADTQLSLSEAKLRVSALEAELATTNHGDLCPICKTGRLRVTKVKEHHSLGILEWHTSTCDHAGCKYENKSLFNTGSRSYVSGGKN